MTSNESRKMLENLQSFCELLEKEGVDPINALSGYIISGDPSYLGVHKGYNRALKFEIAKIDRYDLMETILKIALNK